MMKKGILTIVSTCLLYLLLPATTIVIYITPDFVIIAADSKAVYTNATTYRESSKVVSKIYKSGNIYFSLAGLTSNPTRSLDVGKIVDTKLQTSGDISKAIEAIKTEVTQTLLTYLTNQKKNNYRLFKTNLSADTYITSIGFITITNKKPYAYILGFKVKDGAQITITTEEDFYAQTSSRDAVYYLGNSGEINKYMNSITSNNLKPVDFVNKLMDLQIAKTPLQVGHPVDMLRLTPQSTEWIRRQKSTPIELTP